MDSLKVIVLESKKRLTLLRNTLQDIEGHVTLCGTFRESKHLKYSRYAAFMSHKIESKPSNYKESVGQQVWKNSMMEEYQSIMKNDVWKIVSRLEGKSVVTSKWIYKIKHVVDGNIEKHKTRFVARGFSQKEGEDYEEICSSFQMHLY